MDVIALVAERKIEEAAENGLFDNLPQYGPIDCSLHGAAFVAKWFREKWLHEKEERAE
jgi:Domain of unknown function (DUF1992)